MFFKKIDMNGHRLEAYRVIEDGEKTGNAFDKSKLVKLERISISSNCLLGSNAANACILTMYMAQDAFEAIVKLSTPLTEEMFNKLKKHVHILSELSGRAIKNCG